MWSTCLFSVPFGLYVYDSFTHDDDMDLFQWANTNFLTNQVRDLAMQIYQREGCSWKEGLQAPNLPQDLPDLRKLVARPSGHGSANLAMEQFLQLQFPGPQFPPPPDAVAGLLLLAEDPDAVDEDPDAVAALLLLAEDPADEHHGV